MISFLSKHLPNPKTINSQIWIGSEFLFIGKRWEKTQLVYFFCFKWFNFVLREKNLKENLDWVFFCAIVSCIDCIFQAFLFRNFIAERIKENAFLSFWWVSHFPNRIKKFEGFNPDGTVFNYNIDIHLLRIN